MHIVFVEFVILVSTCSWRIVFGVYLNQILQDLLFDFNSACSCPRAVIVFYRCCLLGGVVSRFYLCVFSQELFELAQRKFLRQLSEYAEATGELYPRLIFIDCQENTEGRLGSRVVKGAYNRLKCMVKKNKIK